MRESCAAADIKSLQLVISTVQLSKFGVLADVKPSQRVIIAVEECQRSAAADIKSLQTVAAADHHIQLSVLAQVELSQIIFAAIQISQLGILAQVEFRQLICDALQIIQHNEILDALKAHYAHVGAADSIYGDGLCHRQDAVIIRVKVHAYVASKSFVGEVRIVYKQIPAFIKLRG